MRLKGKTALITGASRNIGKQISLTFAKEGADLLLNTRKSHHELDDVAVQCRELGASVYTLMGDVSEPECVTKIVRDGLKFTGKLDILVSNVAIRPHKQLLDISNEEWLQVLNVNLNSTFYLLKALLPHMIKQRRGSIIALGGQTAITGRSKTAAVAASKTGLLGLIRVVAAEMGTYNIRANMVNPGSTDTNRQHPEWYPELQTQKREAPDHLKSIPLQRQATVSDIANACLFLASDDAGYITGEQLNVVGGNHMI